MKILQIFPQQFRHLETDFFVRDFWSKNRIKTEIKKTNEHYVFMTNGPRIRDQRPCYQLVYIFSFFELSRFLFSLFQALEAQITKFHVSIHRYVFF